MSYSSFDSMLLAVEAGIGIMVLPCGEAKRFTGLMKISLKNVPPIKLELAWVLASAQEGSVVSQFVEAAAQCCGVSMNCYSLYSIFGVCGICSFYKVLSVVTIRQSKSVERNQHMNSSGPPRFINLVIGLECVLLAAFLILLSPVGDLISDSVPASGQIGERGSSGAEGTGGRSKPGEESQSGGTGKFGEESQSSRAGKLGEENQPSGTSKSGGESQSTGENKSGGESKSVEENRDGRASKSSEESGDIGKKESTEKSGENGETQAEEKKDFIKWVDFQVTKEAMEKAFRYDVDTCQSQIHLSWIELLAYLGARYGGDFSRYKAADMEAIAQRLMDGEKMEDITADMKYYSYYLEAYTAVLGGMVGEFKVEIPASKAPEFVLKANEAAGNNPGNGDDAKVWVTKYGLKAFSPIAKNYPYNDYDDFGVARSYGFKRQHLGHDMMGQVGTPVIAVESGYVEAIGWNQYGGWRLGIRSFDGKRYYYYAHLRKNYPYHKSLQEGSVVQAGDVIGYLGRTGYSRTENTNNIDEAHLHFGIQLIFDESQKEGNNEIWIDCYELVKFLAVNRSETVKKQETKEYYRVYQMVDPVIPGGPVEQRIPQDSAEAETESREENVGVEMESQGAE